MLSKDQLDLIEQFEADYNVVDRFLRKALGDDKQVPFTYLVSHYSRQHLAWQDADLLRTIGELRNAIVHGKTEPYRYIAIPSPATAKDLRRCKERLTSPERAIPAFQRKVDAISIHDSLAKVLEIITRRNYSQFPVYEDKQFRGLLTENGITRWLGQHVVTNLSLVDLDDVPVAQVLKNEEERINFRFVARNMLVDDVRGLFACNVLLEAVLITAHGKESETLLGIGTRWDIIRRA
jgi:predicted transcriptional regulator